MYITFNLFMHITTTGSYMFNSYVAIRPARFKTSPTVNRHNFLLYATSSSYYRAIAVYSQATCTQQLVLIMCIYTYINYEVGVVSQSIYSYRPDFRSEPMNALCMQKINTRASNSLRIFYDQQLTESVTRDHRQPMSTQTPTGYVPVPYVDPQDDDTSAPPTKVHEEPDQYHPVPPTRELMIHMYTSYISP